MLTKKHQENIISEKKAYVVFSLDNKKFALTFSRVVNVLRMVEISCLPYLHPFVLGVINYHGKILPVFNLRKHMNYPEKEIDLNDSLIIILGKEKYFAIWANSVDEVLEIPESEIISFDNMISGVKGVKGFVNQHREVVLIQDAVIHFEKILLVNEDKKLTGFSEKKYGT